MPFGAEDRERSIMESICSQIEPEAAFRLPSGVVCGLADVQIRTKFGELKLRFQSNDCEHGRKRPGRRGILALMTLLIHI